MDDAQSAERLRTLLREQGCRTEVLSGKQAAADVAALDEVDQVMAGHRWRGRSGADAGGHSRWQNGVVSE